MKTVPSGLLAHYASGGTRLARLWLITRRDGTVFAFTDHDAEIHFGGVHYLPTSSFDASAISTRDELNVDNLDATGILDDDGITAADIEAGLWDGARLELREVNWSNLANGANILRVGELGKVDRARGQYTTELRGLMQKLQNAIGRVVTPTCDADLGDARCGVDLDGSPTFTNSATIASASGRRSFTLAGVSRATGYFDGGKVHFSSGANVGFTMEIKSHVFDHSPPIATFELQLEMPYAIAPGDAVTVTPGCDKTKATCIAKFNNVVNFRGFSSVPGQDSILLVGGQ